MKFNLNIKEVEFYKKEISYADIIQMAGYKPDAIVTVTISMPNGQGISLTPGSMTMGQEGMNVTAVITNNA